jgi:hypothetical protein
MQLDSLKSSATNWMKPPIGGYRNSRAAGFLVGFAFGPAGVGIFLRSIPDFVLSLVMCLIVICLVDAYAAPICWMATGIWVVARMKRCLPQSAASPPSESASELDPAWEATTKPRSSSV